MVITLQFCLLLVKWIHFGKLVNSRLRHQPFYSFPSQYDYFSRYTNSNLDEVKVNIWILHLRDKDDRYGKKIGLRPGKFKEISSKF